MNKSPKVGMGVTRRNLWDDCPATIIEVSKSGRSIEVRDDKVLKGIICRDLEGQVSTYTLRQNGAWVIAGTSQNEMASLTLDGRRFWEDPNMPEFVYKRGC